MVTTLISELYLIDDLLLIGHEPNKTMYYLVAFCYMPKLDSIIKEELLDLSLGIQQVSKF